MEYTAINFEEKLAKFSDHFSPKIIAKMNDYHFKLAKFQGDYIWHLDNPTNHLLKSHSLLACIVLMFSSSPRSLYNPNDL
jgi:hypothetical protein